MILYLHAHQVLLPRSLWIIDQCTVPPSKLCAVDWSFVVVVQRGRASRPNWPVGQREGYKNPRTSLSGMDFDRQQIFRLSKRQAIGCGSIRWVNADCVVILLTISLADTATKWRFVSPSVLSLQTIELQKDQPLNYPPSLMSMSHVFSLCCV